jgi:type I restriction-modification system DNA methylase subunit
LCGILHGPVDAADFKTFIFPLLFFKRISDVYDEEYTRALQESDGDVEFAQFPENHRFQVPEGCHWKDARAKSASIGHALQKAMRCIEQANPDTLHGKFGDAQWTNKDRLSDALLKDLIEHFSSLDLGNEHCRADVLGQAYEYLINLRLFGQERNLLTSAIGRMNLFLHGIEDFSIVRGDTLANPAFVAGDRLMQFDVVLANPPYSIKQWDRDGWSADPWGRNIYGTPPQGRADYAFWQHIIASMKTGSGHRAFSPTSTSSTLSLSIRRLVKRTALPGRAAMTRSGRKATTSAFPSTFERTTPMVTDQQKRSAWSR